MFQDRFKNPKFDNLKDEGLVHLKNLHNRVLEAIVIKKKIKGQYDLGRSLLQQAKWIGLDR